MNFFSQPFPVERNQAKTGLARIYVSVLHNMGLLNPQLSKFTRVDCQTLQAHGFGLTKAWLLEEDLISLFFPAVNRFKFV